MTMGIPAKVLKKWKKMDRKPVRERSTVKSVYKLDTALGKLAES